MASFQRRPGGWRAVIRRTGHPTTSKTFPTKYAAEQWARQIEREMDQGQFAKPDANVTPRTLFQAFIDNPPEGRRGLKWDTTRLKKLMRAPWTAKPVHEVTELDVKAWMQGQKISAPSLRRELVLMSGVFSVAVKKGAATVNPLAKIPLPRDSKWRNRRPTEAELTKLRGYFAGRKMLLLLELALETGMRLGELCGMTWANVHDHHVHIPMTKNGDPRNVPLSSRARELLALRGAGRVFSFSAVSAGVYWREACKELQIKNLHFHDLRHEAATQMAGRLTVLELAAVLGHRDLKSLQRYYNPTPQELSAKLG